MKLFYSTTSPFARLVRMALIEKGISQVEEVLVDPWQDRDDLLEANPSARVPALTLDDGRSLTESQFILAWLEMSCPHPSLRGQSYDATMSLTGVAMGGIEAAAAIIIGRRMTNADFDESAVGLRRRRSIVSALQLLERHAAELPIVAPSLATMASVVLLKYLRFRFPAAAWMPSVPALNAMCTSLKDRPSFAQTAPKGMPLVPVS